MLRRRVLVLRLLVGDRRHHTPLHFHLTAAVGGEDGKVVGEEQRIRDAWSSGDAAIQSGGEDEEVECPGNSHKTCLRYSGIFVLMSCSSVE